MENKGLLFIPDISGFTRFVSETEIDHSRHIIQELLETLINSNTLGLEISEIEGDAILFFKYGAPPNPEEVYRQVEKMFCAFHKSLFAYEHRRYCQCKACDSAIDLTLKVITHYGEFTEYSVQKFNKLLGKDIIVAHQLLKNDIGTHEYWLATKSLLPDDPPAEFTEWMKWNSSSKQTDNGELVFHFTQLGPLKNTIEEEPSIQPDLSKKVKIISASREYETDIITLFHATGDFNYRSSWQEGVEKVEEINHYLPRVGMRCKSYMDNGEMIIYSSSYYYRSEKIEFTETNETKKLLTYYTLDKITETRTRLTIDYYLEKKFPTTLLYNLFSKGREEMRLQKSLLNLDRLVKTIHSTA